MLDLKNEHVGMIRGVLSEHLPNGRRALVFGSRVKGTAWRFSDVDIAIDGPEPMSLSEISDLKEAFSLSDLPYMVDIVDLQTADPGFRGVVYEKHVVIYDTLAQ